MLRQHKQQKEASRAKRKGLKRVKTWVTEEDTRPRLPSLEEEVEQQTVECNTEVETARFDSKSSMRKVSKSKAVVRAQSDAD